MLRDGLQCVFDPIVFKDAIAKIAIDRMRTYGQLYRNSVYGTSTVGGMEEYMSTYVRSDMTQLFPDKCWVNTFYESEDISLKFRYNVKIVSLTHGTCTLSFSAIMLDISSISSIFYDEFGMIPKIMENGFKTEVWLRHRFQKLLWEQRDIGKLVRMVEDPLLKFTLTTPLLEEFLEKTTEYEWPDATVILLRAIHDRKEGIQEEENPMRL